MTKILFTIPEKSNDPTKHTASWARNAVNVARSLGYQVIILEKEQTTHENVSKALRDNGDNGDNSDQIKLFVHYGHGCLDSLQGNRECMLNRRYSVPEVVEMYDNGIKSGDFELINLAQRILEPMGYLANPLNCQLSTDPCQLVCSKYETNVQLLKGKIAFTTACLSAGGLGKCAVKNGCLAYVGSEELYLFPVDSMGTQNLYGNLQLIGLKELLLGKSVGDAVSKMEEEEDRLIRKFVGIKYIALTLLWNKKYRRLLGNRDATI